MRRGRSLLTFKMMGVGEPGRFVPSDHLPTNILENMWMIKVEIHTKSTR